MKGWLRCIKMLERYSENTEVGRSQKRSKCYLHYLTGNRYTKHNLLYFLKICSQLVYSLMRFQQFETHTSCWITLHICRWNHGKTVLWKYICLGSLFVSAIWYLRFHCIEMTTRLFSVDQILYMMEPDSWSAASIYAATRIFCSSLNAKMAQRYVSSIKL